MTSESQNVELLLTLPYGHVQLELQVYFGDPSLTAVQSEMRLVNGIFAPSNISQQLRLGLWGIGLVKAPWFTPGFSYCSW